jgi:hypothetical protein
MSLVIGFFALCQQVQSATDTPDPGGSLPVSNTADGQLAVASLTTGIYNSAFGIYSLLSLTDGSFCTAVGGAALLSNTADGNTATGAAALLSNTTGGLNTANGAFALFNNTTGSRNNATGSNALFTNTFGTSNNAFGYRALFSNITGLTNNAFGDQALHNNTAGNGNSAFGDGALFNTTGQDNTAIGSFAGINLTTGGNNVVVGSAAGTGVTTANNVICIGAQVAGFDVGDSCFIGNIRDALVAPDAQAVLVDSTGKLGTTSGSSRRFKKEIKAMDRASEDILALKPVTFHYECDAIGTPQFGLIAEEVANVNPDLVVCDKNGEIYTVRYEAVNAMLLNEFLKEHRIVQEQGATIARQQKQIEALTAGLQKVSAQLEVLKPVPQTAMSNR